LLSLGLFPCFFDKSQALNVKQATVSMTSYYPDDSVRRDAVKNKRGCSVTGSFRKSGLLYDHVSHSQYQIDKIKGFSMYGEAS
jgi:hypothetical protein